MSRRPISDEQPTRQLTVRLPENVLDEIKKRAKAQGHSVSLEAYQLILKGMECSGQALPEHTSESPR